MRQTAVLLVLVMTASGCLTPRQFEGVVRNTVRDAVVTTVVVTAVVQLAALAVSKAIHRRRRKEAAPENASVDEKWKHARRNRRR